MEEGEGEGEGEEVEAGVEEEAEEDPEDLIDDGHPVDESANDGDALHHGITITNKGVDLRTKVFLISSTYETNSCLNGGSEKRRQACPVKPCFAR